MQESSGAKAFWEEEVTGAKVLRQESAWHIRGCVAEVGSSSRQDLEGDTGGPSGALRAL